jgi:hypothetical protein
MYPLRQGDEEGEGARAMPSRPRVEPTDDRHQIELLARTDATGVV